MRLKTIELGVCEEVARAFSKAGELDARNYEITVDGKPYLVLAIFLDGKPRVQLAPMKKADRMPEPRS